MTTTNIGGQIDAANALAVAAGRDLNVTSTTSSGAGQIGLNTFSRTGLERIAGLYVSDPGGTLLASAGRDVNLTAAILQSQGSVGITAGNNINLATVAAAQSANSVRDARNYVRSSQSQEVGSQISAQGPLALSAGNNINAVAATLQSQQGVQLNAAGSVSLSAGLATSNFEDAQFAQSRGWLSSASRTSRDTQNSTQAIGTSVGGKTVDLSAGQDIRVKGSSVISDSATTLRAGNNVSIEAATDTSRSTSFLEKKESGFLSGGGFGISYGNREQSTDNKGQSTTAAASTVGSIGGNVSITAGQAYRQVGSNVIAPTGDISITAKKVDIVEARETSQSTTEQKFKQTALTLSIGSPVLSAVQQAQSLAQAAGNTSDARMQALAGASAALNVYNNADAIGQSAKALTSGNPQNAVSITASIGSSKSQSLQQSQSDSARGSSVSASGNVNIAATGAGSDSNLTVQGSSIQAGNSARLTADNQVKLLAAQNTSSQTGTNTSSSGSLSVSYGAGGWSFGASAAKGKGSSDGADSSATNTQIAAGNTAIIQSGGDTTLKGAVVAANTVTAKIGGNLRIESLQDTASYASKQSSVGGSISVGATGITGGGASGSQSKIDSNFASVGQQSGIKAGDGGFNVTVNNNTDLKGAVIASNQAAVEQGKNSFATSGNLSTSNIQNSASFNGSAAGVSADVGQQAGKFGVSGVGAGIGSDKGSASSTTTAGISGIAGNTAVRSTDAEAGLKKIFDPAKVQKEIDAQVQITQAFSKEAPKAVAKFATSQIDDLKTQAKLEADPAKKQALLDEANKWSEGGRYRVLLHTLAGAFSGGASGAAGAVAIAGSAPLMNQLQDSLANGLQAAGLGADGAKGIAQVIATLTAAGVGAAVGGAQGAATAATVDANNRQLHPTELQRIKELANGDDKKQYRLTAAACALAKCYAEYAEGSATYNALKTMADAGSSDAMAAERQQLQAQQGLFNYSTQGLLSDKNIDAAKQFNNAYQVTDRAIGAGQAVLDGVGVAGSLVTAPVSCATGVGCVANAVVGTLSVDAVLTGGRQLVSGQPENTSLNNALQALGLSPEAAMYAEFALGVGAGAKVGGVANAVTTSQAAKSAAAKLSYEDIAKFGAKGVNVTPEVMQTPQAKALVAEYQAANNVVDDAVRYARGVLQTGTNVPTVRTVGVNEELIKVVPKSAVADDGVKISSPFFMTRSEYDALSKLSPAEIGQRLGLPAEQSVRGAQLGFEAYAITPKPGTTPKVFTSTVAPVEQGAYKASGGSQQTIVPNRSQWTEPRSIGSIGSSK